MKVPRPGSVLPSWQNALLALISAAMLTLSFPNFDLWYLAWFALVPLMWAIERERRSVARSFVLGWLFGTFFFFSTCWWLTFAPINYAGFPPLLAYSLLFCVTAVAGLFPGVFAGVMASLVKRFGSLAMLAAPFVFVSTEFLRYWLTGNNWNAVGYSQAFGYEILQSASIGGVYLVSFAVVLFNAFLLWSNLRLIGDVGKPLVYLSIFSFWIVFAVAAGIIADKGPVTTGEPAASVIAIQPNVPMEGLDSGKLISLRQKQIDVAEARIIEQRSANNELPIIVILPESPMNFMYEDDREFRFFINEFSSRNQVSVLFNSAEPDKTNGKYFNSAVMVGPDGREAAQYDKIYLLPFGEAVPFMLEGLLPGFVGNFSYGGEYDLLPLGEAKAGVMICFESHFGQLSREYVRNGADAIIEMTNDGYLGPTPVLRQHLANAVFRAVETNRPVLRVTNVGITAYINERGQIIDLAPSYEEASRVWTVARADGSQTFYVRFGDWFAWLCSAIAITLLALTFRRFGSEPPAVAGG